jgi:hypothetical protein
MAPATSHAKAGHFFCEKRRAPALPFAAGDEGGGPLSATFDGVAGFRSSVVRSTSEGSSARFGRSAGGGVAVSGRAQQDRVRTVGVLMTGARPAETRHLPN